MQLCIICVDFVVKQLMCSAQHPFVIVCLLESYIAVRTVCMENAFLVSCFLVHAQNVQDSSKESIRLFPLCCPVNFVHVQGNMKQGMKCIYLKHI